MALLGALSLSLCMTGRPWQLFRHSLFVPHPSPPPPQSPAALRAPPCVRLRTCMPVLPLPALRLLSSEFMEAVRSVFEVRAWVVCFRASQC